MNFQSVSLGLGFFGLFFALLFRVRRASVARLRFPGVSTFRGLPPSLRVQAYRLRPWLLGLGVLCWILAVARPRAGKTIEVVRTHGVDIMVALDVSGSMAQGHDLSPSRLVVAKKVLDRFVSGRRHDRIGLVVFRGEAFTRCPLTLDYSILRQSLGEIDGKAVGADGTAIGMALGSAIQRLRSSKARSRVVILITDGANNAGALAPEDASKIAKSEKVKLYTIGVGGDGRSRQGRAQALYGLFAPQAPALDEDLLKRLASETGGRYFRATDNQALAEILQIIDRLESSEIETQSFTRYQEYFFPLVALGWILLGFEAWLGWTLGRSVP